MAISCVDSPSFFTVAPSAPACFGPSEAMPMVLSFVPSLPKNSSAFETPKHPAKFLGGLAASSVSMGASWSLVAAVPAGDITIVTPLLVEITDVFVETQLDVGAADTNGEDGSAAVAQGEAAELVAAVRPDVDVVVVVAEAEAGGLPVTVVAAAPAVVAGGLLEVADSDGGWPSVRGCWFTVLACCSLWRRVVTPTKR